MKFERTPDLFTNSQAFHGGDSLAGAAGTDYEVYHSGCEGFCVTTAAIMTRDPLTVRDDESVADAAAKLISHHYMSLPVVDLQGRYTGMFGIYDLLGLLLPRVALAGNLMSNLRFISDDPDELRRRYTEVKSRRVSDVVDRNGARLNPDSPEIEAIRLCCRSHAAIPVVEKNTEKVIGIVSCWDALRTLAGTPKSA